MCREQLWPLRATSSRRGHAEAHTREPPCYKAQTPHHTQHAAQTPRMTGETPQHHRRRGERSAHALEGEVARARDLVRPLVLLLADALERAVVRALGERVDRVFREVVWEPVLESDPVDLPGDVGVYAVRVAIELLDCRSGQVRRVGLGSRVRRKPPNESPGLFGGRSGV